MNAITHKQRILAIIHNEVMSCSIVMYTIKTIQFAAND